MNNHDADSYLEGETFEPKRVSVLIVANRVVVPHAFKCQYGQSYSTLILINLFLYPVCLIRTEVKV